MCFRQSIGCKEKYGFPRVVSPESTLFYDVSNLVSKSLRTGDLTWIRIPVKPPRWVRMVGGTSPSRRRSRRGIVTPGAKTVDPELPVVVSGTV